jgi:hypothetical protein
VRLKDGERATVEEFKEFCKGKIAHYEILRCFAGHLSPLARAQIFINFGCSAIKGILPCELYLLGEEFRVFGMDLLRLLLA